MWCARSQQDELYAPGDTAEHVCFVVRGSVGLYSAHVTKCVTRPPPSPPSRSRYAATASHAADHSHVPVCSPSVRVNLHHVSAPSFCGEYEIQRGLRRRAHTAVCTSDGTTVLLAPAKIFLALTASEEAKKAYNTHMKLGAARNCREQWCVPVGGVAHSCPSVGVTCCCTPAVGL